MPEDLLKDIIETSFKAIKESENISKDEETVKVSDGIQSQLFVEKSKIIKEYIQKRIDNPIMDFIAEDFLTTDNVFDKLKDKLLISKILKESKIESDTIKEMEDLKKDLDNIKEDSATKENQLEQIKSIYLNQTSQEKIEKVEKQEPQKENNPIIKTDNPEQKQEPQKDDIQEQKYELTWEISKENTNYTDIVSTIIGKIEWWYYDPKTMYTSKMWKSGETMMGIDRKHWGSLNTSADWKEFWRLIDEDKLKNPEARKKHWYKWWELEPKLKTLAWKIIKPHYEKLCSRYLSDEAIKIVNTDGRLMFNFIYWAWNWAWRFQKMAKQIDKDISNWIKDTNVLAKNIVNRRINKSWNSLIAQWGRKIEKIVWLA